MPPREVRDGSDPYFSNGRPPYAHAQGNPRLADFPLGPSTLAAGSRDSHDDLGRIVYDELDAAIVQVRDMQTQVTTNMMSSLQVEDTGSQLQDILRQTPIDFDALRRLQPQEEELIDFLELLMSRPISADGGNHPRLHLQDPNERLQTMRLRNDHADTFPRVQRMELSRPITTIVSTLPRTSYKEDKDAGYSLMPPNYSQVQMKVLQYLRRFPADALTATMAREWTMDIDPQDHSPTAVEALRFCYYMRSQGFDTYARWSGDNMGLFLVNRNSFYKDADYLYWKQNVKTGQIDKSREPAQATYAQSDYAQSTFTPYSRPRGLGARRNALSYGRSGQLRGGDLRSHHFNAEHGLDESQNEPDHSVPPFLRDDMQSAIRDSERRILTSRLVTAQQELEGLLLSNARPATINSAIQNVENFQRLIDRL